MADEAQRHLSGDDAGLALDVAEPVLQPDMISDTASYRVIVSRKVRESEPKLLIAMPELDREILAHPARETGYYRLADDDTYLRPSSLERCCVRLPGLPIVYVR
jgi:hypothetical protein